MANFLNSTIKKVIEKSHLILPRMGNHKRHPYDEFVNLFNLFNASQLPPMACCLAIQLQKEYRGMIQIKELSLK